MLSLLKKKFFIIIFLLPIVISCSTPKMKNKIEDLSHNYNNQSINLNNLIVNLYKADNNLTPKLIRNNDGSSFYSYIKKPGEGEIFL